MQVKIWLIAGLALVGLQGCVPLVAVGGAVVADEIVEDRQGGDGLF